MNDEITRIELNDELDLHYFHPKYVKDLLKDFIDDSYNKGKKEIRIVHGKGKSVMKSIVISELKKNNKIAGYKDDHGNWRLEGDPIPLCWSVKASKP